MRRLVAVVFGVLLGGGLVYTAFSYHVVYAEEGLLMVPKQQANLSDVYVDIRDWTVGDWETHAGLAGSLTAHGRGDLVVESVTNPLFRGLMKGFRGMHNVPPDEMGQESQSLDHEPQPVE